jgi:hypothetical protein
MRASIIAIIGLLAWNGCATLSGSQDHYYVCSYDITWEASLETIKDRPITLQNKEKGQIETGWIDVPAPERPYGMFGREGFDTRERARMTISVKKHDDVVAISVLETRQRWHLRGGATQEATKWWPIEPSKEAETAVVNRINSALKEKGCTPS